VWRLNTNTAPVCPKEITHILNATIQAKATLASLLSWTGLISWKLRQHLRNDIAVLAYHRIIPERETGPTVEAGMVVHPETLDLHLQYLQRYFEIVPLDHLASNMHGNAPGKPRKPLCALTFDDGWRDFYEYAFPILLAHGAPATVFLPTDFIGTNRWFWTDRLALLLHRLAQLKDGNKRAFQLRDPLLRRIVCTPGKLEKKLAGTIAMLKPLRLEKIEELVSQLAAVVEEHPNPQGRAFLTWEEVQEMYRSGLITFGSHTAAHSFMTALPENQAQLELSKSLDVLVARKVVNSDFVSFCYPYGSYSERLSKMVRHAGYHLATTGECGWHRKGGDAFMVKRIPIHQDVSATEAMFASRLADIL
jgi:peptidoglycan/xylan/chitin deacetylase (PgdA/CDA1 family)